MVPQRAHIIAGGEFLHDLDIGSQTGAGENALEQIMAEQGGVGDAPGQRGLEGIDVVDPLAGVGSLTEEVLVDVGDRQRIGVDAAEAGEDALEHRALGADGQGGRHARLKDCIAFDHAAGGEVHAGMIQRMRHLADQAAHRFAGQAGVGIQRDHVANTCRCAGGDSPCLDEAGVLRASQQPVQLDELAALALPAHPALFARVPDAMAMQQQEAVASIAGTVALVELRDALRRFSEQFLVAPDMFGRGIAPIREQGEMQGASGAGEVMDFQPLHLLGNCGFADEQGGDHNHGPHRRRNSVAQFQGRQELSAEARGDRPVDDGHGQVLRREEAQQCQQEEPRIAHAGGADGHQRQRQNEPRHDGDGCDIAVDPTGPHQDRGPSSQGCPASQFLLEGLPAACQQMISWVCMAWTQAGTSARGCDGAVRDIQLRPPRMAREFLDGAAVEIARCEIHAPEGAARCQHLVHEAHTLDHLIPVEIGDEAQAGDDVAHTEIGSTLGPMEILHEAIDRRTARGQAFIQPGESGYHRRGLVAQPMDELNGEGIGQRAGLELREGQMQWLTGLAVGAQKAFGHAICFLLRGAIGNDLLREAPEVLDQHDAQCDRNSPELPQRERLELLIGMDEEAEILWVEAAVGVRHEGPRHAEDARISGEGPVGQLGELTIIPWWKI